ncbi:MAG: hypothetical protein HYR90_03670 [Candidatus Andersenbacteria bacterium]|nr:hypothetical protein [Candidatus Andersenbacteria bacterium]MBI3250363.1 hypothetical protein [Candidatus Andersenbacteria bacterium]
MLDLIKLNEEILKKIQILLSIVRSSINLDGGKLERVIIPKVNFENKGLLLSDVETLLNRIEREENELLSIVPHSPRDHQPRPSSSDHLMIEAMYGVPADEHYAEKKQKYNEIYSKSFEIKIPDHKRLDEFEELIDSEIKNQSNLICGELRFNSSTGEVEYFDLKDRLLPGTKEFLLLRALLAKKGEWISYEEIVRVIDRDEKKAMVKSDGKRIRSLVRNIKNKLGMTDAGAKKLGITPPLPSLFSEAKQRTRNGVAMTCN